MDLEYPNKNVLPFCKSKQETFYVTKQGTNKNSEVFCETKIGIGR